MGNWEADVLTKQQLQYAATDAYISWYLYEVHDYTDRPTLSLSLIIDLNAFILPDLDNHFYSSLGTTKSSRL